MKDYWNEEINDICDGVIFKFKKLNPIDTIQLVTRNIDFDKSDTKTRNSFINECLQHITWTIDGVTWNNLVDSEGNNKLAVMDEQPQIAYDLFHRFRYEVIYPVFLESKTFQNLMQENIDQKA